MHDSTDLILVERLAKALVLINSKLVTAESCTGGGIAHLLTSVPGSSRWFERGFITYSNEAKQELLGVPYDTLQNYGAVSEPAAEAMAAGAISNSHADFSIAVTGIAGPDGGTDDKPVGTVCFAWGVRDGETRTTQIIFPGDRQQVRDQAILMSIQGLLDIVEREK